MTEARDVSGIVRLLLRSFVLLHLALCALMFGGMIVIPRDAAALLGLSSLAMFVAAWKRPLWALSAIVLLFPLLPLLPSILRIANLSLPSYLLAAFAAGRGMDWVFRRGGVSLPGTPVRLPLLLFLFCVWVSCLFSFFRYTDAANGVFVSDLLYGLPGIFFEREGEGDVFLSLRAALQWTFGAVFFLSLSARMERIGLNRIASLLAVGAAVSLGFGLVQRLTGQFIPDGWTAMYGRSRIVGLFPDPNSFGTYLASLLFLFLIPGVRGKYSGDGASGRRWAFVAVSVALLIGVVLTGSRSAWFSTLVLLLALAVSAGRAIRKRRVSAAPGMGSGAEERRASLPAVGRGRPSAAGVSRIGRRWTIAFGVVGFLAFASIYEWAIRTEYSGERRDFVSRALHVVNRSDSFNHILKGRPTLWYTGAKMMRERPLAGVGIGLYREAMPEFLKFGQRYWWAAVKENAHNMFLQIGGEMGLPGLFAFVWIWAAVLGAYLRVPRDDRARLDPLVRGSFWGLVALLLTSLGAHPLIQMEIQVLFWILVGMLFSRLPHPAGYSTSGMLSCTAVFGAGLVSLLGNARCATAIEPYLHYHLGLHALEGDRWTPLDRRYRWTRERAVLLVRRDSPLKRLELTMERPGVALEDRVTVFVQVGHETPRNYPMGPLDRAVIDLNLIPYGAGPVPVNIYVDPVWLGWRTAPDLEPRVLGARLGLPLDRTPPPGSSEGFGAAFERDGMVYRAIPEQWAWESVVPDGASFRIPVHSHRPSAGRLIAGIGDTTLGEVALHGGEQVTAVEGRCGGPLDGPVVVWYFVSRKGGGAGDPGADDKGAIGIGPISWRP